MNDVTNNLSIILATGALIGVGTFAYNESNLGKGEEVLSVDKASLEVEMQKTKTAGGDYVQILKDRTVDGGKTFDTKALPANTWTNVYDGPKGKGYQIVTKYPDRIEHTGYGPSAEDYTYTVIIPPIVASTSPQ
jgi:hypothetical protein